MDKTPGMCGLRFTLCLTRSWEPKKDQVRLESSPARPFDQLRAGCWRILVPSLIIRGRVKGFATGSGVRHCKVMRYDLFVSAGEFFA